MQVYKCFMKILKKRAGSIVMYMGIFIALCVITSSQGKESEEMKFEASQYQLAVFDQDQSEVSQGLTDYLAEQNTLVSLQDEAETIQDEIYNRNIHCALRIQNGFGRAAAQGQGDGMIEITAVPGTVYGEAFTQTINGYMSILGTYLRGGFAVNEALERTKQAMELSASVSMADGGNDGTYSKLYYFFKYLAYIYIVVCIEALGPVLITFRKKEVRDRIVSSPYPVNRSSLGQYAGMITLGAVLVLIHMVMLLVMRIPFFSFQGMLFLLNELCYLAVCLGIVFFIGQVVTNIQLLSMIANVVGLGSSFLGGVFVPLEMMGERIVSLAHILPSYWYVRACQQIDFLEQGESLRSVLACMGVEILFGMALFCIGLAYSKTASKGRQ
ncbi:MAG: ABC transporter permease [Lachnospiraceae bacterium]|nr:ABC transporter permease [Lachnospiraceae bacterium]